MAGVLAQMPGAAQQIAGVIAGLGRQSRATDATVATGLLRFARNDGDVVDFE
jgi:hypothetical protein